MTLSYEIIGIACLAVLLAEASGIMQRLKWKLYGPQSISKRLKPLDCPLCLAFWLGLFFALLQPHSWQCTLLMPGTAAILALIISKYIKS